MTEFGLFVEVESHFVGLIPKKYVPTGEHFEKGDMIIASIESVDPPTRRILLNYKGRAIEVFEKYTEGRSYHGKVVVIKNFGLLVELEPGVTGICHISQFPLDDQRKLPELYPIGKESEWIVISVDPTHGRVELAPSK